MRCIWLAVLALLPSAAPAQNVCHPSELVTRFGDWKALSIPIRLSAPSQDITPKTRDGQLAASMRLLIAAPNPGAKPWSLAIRDRDGHLLSQLERSDFPSASSTLWTGRLTGSMVTVTLRGGDADTFVEVRGASASGPPNSDQNGFSISGATAQWRDFYTGAPHSHAPAPPNRRDPAEAVGIFVDDTLAPAAAGPPGTRTSWCCTGVMIGRNLYLTNWHCAGPKRLWDGEVRGNAVIDLAWENGPIRRQFSVSEVVAQNEDLDFAILRIQPAAGADGGVRTTFPVQISTAPISPGQSIYMIHHAQCQPKLISDNCHVQSASRAAWTDPLGGAGAKTEITHDCDTEPGASGAPIFDPQGRLIALHHLGHQKAASPMCPIDNVNKAVKMSAISDFIKASVDPKYQALVVELGW